MRCSVFAAVSLDGFIARADGGIDWLSIVAEEGEDYGYRKFRDSVDTVVVGRKTYDLALGFDDWPFACKRCVVLTKAERISVHGEEFHQGPVGALVERLAKTGAKRVYVDGGSVIRQFVAEGFVTDLTLSIVPVLLGDGVRLFGSTRRDVRLQLTGKRAFRSGLVRLEYRVDDQHV